MSKILLILNNAPEPRKWFNNMYSELSTKHDVVLVAESKLISSLFPGIMDEINIHYFSEYFKKNYNNLNLKTQMDLNDINLWESYFSDYERNELYFDFTVNNKEYYNRLMICLYSFFEEIFLKEKIDCIIYENISNSFAYSAYNVGSYYNIPYIGLVLSRLPGRFEIYRGPISEKNEYIKKFNYFLESNNLGVEKDEIETYIKDFDNISHVNDIVTHPKFSLVNRYLNIDKFQYIKQVLRFIVSSKIEMKYAYQTRNPILSSYKTTIDNIKRKIKLKWLIKIYDRGIKNENFYLYPLHYHPESSTSVHARHYIDELNTITNIAFNLPFGKLLYVKDHPSAAGNPPIKFYTNLKKIPNVRLLNHELNIKNLIKKSEGIITLTSTVGFEALMYNKPVYVLGDVFYEFHPLCRKINSYEDLWVILKESKNVVLPTISMEATAFAIFGISIKWDEAQIGKLALKLIKEIEV
jgi:hypothetical protein